MEVENPGVGISYGLRPSPISSEDILFCFDVGAESAVEMKGTGPGGRPITRLDSIKQATLLFLHSKLSINPDHRFAFALLDNATSWLQKEFTSSVDCATAALRGIAVSPDSSSGPVDLSQVFRVAANEAKKSHAQNRILRVILIYCRSSSPPQYQWPVNQKLFTLDVIYLHDKPGPENCPQKVYDALVDALEHVSEYEGYIFEIGQVIQRVLFRYICTLLSHPQQRCLQDDLDIPKSLAKKPPAVESTQNQENMPVSGQ